MNNLSKLEKAYQEERQARLAVENALLEKNREIENILRVLGEFKANEEQRRKELDERTREVQSAINIFEHQHDEVERHELEFKLFNSVALFSQEKVSFENSLQIIAQAISELYRLPLALAYNIDQQSQENGENSLLAINLLFKLSLKEEKFQGLLDYDHQTYINGPANLVRKTVQLQASQTADFTLDNKHNDCELFTDSNEDNGAMKQSDDERGKLAASLNIHSHFTIPIICKQTVIAVMEFFYDHKSAPANETIKFINTVSLQLGNMQERALAEKELRRNYKKLQSTQKQLIQSEKLASLGQLSAGIAHEINNPVGFVLSNMSSLDQYMEIIKKILQVQEQCIALSGHEENNGRQPLIDQLEEIKSTEDFDFILEDLDALLAQSRQGMERVKEIVAGLSSFARTGEAASSEANVNDCLEATINMVWNELKYKCELEKALGELPVIRCYPSQLNQVFLNLIVNASQAIAEKGKISIRSEVCKEFIKVTISDTGCGISPQNLKNLFNPFFTTKPVGQGTGLGLSISYGIIRDHEGRIEVESEEGKGTRFMIYIPVDNNL